MGAGIPLSKGTWVGSQNPNDAKYFNDTQPWVSVAEVLAGIPIGERHIGLTVNVDKVEYTFKDGIEDADFVLRDKTITINSITTGEPTGSYAVLNVVSLTQAEYDAGAKVATTFYIITD